MAWRSGTHWRSFLICLLLLGRTNWMMGINSWGCARVYRNGGGGKGQHDRNRIVSDGAALNQHTRHLRSRSCSPYCSEKHADVRAAVR